MSSITFLITGCGLLPSSPEEEAFEPEEEISENISEETPKEAPEEPASEDENIQKVSFYGVGDNLIHEQIFNYAQTDEGAYDFKSIYENLADSITDADLSFVNQESIIGGDDLGFSGYPSFNTPSDMIENLVDLGFDIVSGSNNHTLDYGTTGVQNTLNYWADYEEDILFTGAFASQEDRDTIPIIEVDDLNFAILTYTYGTNGLVPDYSYQLNYFDPELITEDVNRAQELSDFVLVSAHWGDEHSFAPNQMQVEYAELFADLGVDVVLGGHSHTIQPIEWVAGEEGNETLVIYSLGNFLASTTSDINLLGGSIQFDFVQEDEEYFIDNVQFEPHVIHYEEGTPGDISTRTNFKLHPLADYLDDLAAQHALNNFEDNIIQVENYEEIVRDVIAEEFLQ